MSLTAAVKNVAAALGFDACGIAAVPAEDPGTQTDPSAPGLLAWLRRRLLAWLAAGHQATMSWMAKNPDRRADPRRVLSGCRSVLVVGLNYDSGARADESPGMGRIARYAWGRDYHLVLGERLAALASHLQTLAPDHRHLWYVDTGPVMEKAWAQQAGLGWIGKHSNLVSHQHGSWLVLGVLLTTLELEPDAPGTDLCGTCSLCIQACPTQAIVEPYVVDARRCLSYLTIEHRGDDISDDLARRVGNHLFGCDDCLDVCPYNAQASPSGHPDFQPHDWALRPSLAQLLTWAETDFRVRTQDSPVRRTKFEGFRRNLRLALASAPAGARSATDASGTP